MHTHLYNFVTANNILTPSQSGFVKGDSTIFQLLSIYNDYILNFDRGLTTQAIFFDLSKAFDKVWHRGLLLKLEAIGIGGSLLSFIENYLSDRFQSVVIKGETSNAMPVTAGVPQGSVLGPLFFLIYINDIVENIEAVIKLFADDTSLSLGTDNFDIRTEILNSDLQRIYNWAIKWKLKFNEEKTELLNFKRGTAPIHDLTFGNVTLVQSSSHKHLGVILQNDCRWGGHIDSVARKVNMLISCLRSYKYQLGRKALETMYKSFILPIFDYADIIWDGCTEGQSMTLENLHLEAIRIITGSVKGTSHQKLYAESGLTSLKERRRTHRLIMYFKIVNGFCPNYLQELLPPLASSVNPYHRRRPYERQVPPVRTELYKNSFFPRTTSDWNSLSDSLKSLTSLSDFKRRINSSKPIVPPYFYFGERSEQIIHCRLRLGMSNLNNDLLARHLTNDPSCQCGHPTETAYHYFLECPQYNTLRQNTIMALNFLNQTEIDAEVLLTGNPLLSVSRNCEIFRFVHQFIKASKRFT